jgi:hypothetical protein
MAFEMVDPAAVGPGARKAGGALAGVLGELGSTSQRPAFYDQLMTDYKVLEQKSQSAKAFEAHAIERAMRMAREMMTPELMARVLGKDKAAEAELAAALMRSAPTPNFKNYTGGALDMQEMAFRDAAVKAGIGELGVMNGNLAGVASGPIKTNTVQGGYQGNIYKEGAPLTATPTEQARIRELGARAGVSRAKAAAGGFAPKEPQRTPMQTRAATLEEDIPVIEEQLGRPLTKTERAEWLMNGKFKIAPTPAGEPKPQAKPAAKPAGKHPKPPQAAVAALWKDPSLKAQFAAKYGPVAADVAMSKKPK